MTRQIRSLVADGKKIEAIRVLREATGIGLAEAKQLVESTQYQSRLDQVAAAGGSDNSFESELVELLLAGKKIEAIKRYREQTQQGLKESKDAVEALAARHGLASRNTGCAGVLLLGLTIVACGAYCIAADQPATTSGETTRTADGWFVHAMKSEFQAGPTEVRVLVPERMDPARRYKVLYVLPVEANLEHRYGDGLAEVKRCDIHNKHNLICVAPTFAHLPWYADHPTDPLIRQETYFVKDIVPLVERLYPAQADRRGRWLIGFSKSGWGAWSLLARHPDLFDRAAAWDAPLEMSGFDQYGAAQVFGTQSHFESYRVLPALKECTSLLDSPPRLILTGYDSFRSHHENAHRLLDEAKIPHVYRDGPQRKHLWDSGWVDEAVELLVKSEPQH